MNNNWHKKEKPLLGLTGLGGGVDGLSVVGAASKTYVDDVFSTYLYKGNASERSITTGIDIAGEGGMVWFKNRDNGNQDHRLFDTTQPPQSSSPYYSYPIYTNASYARGPSANGLKSFNSDGFSVYTDNSINGNNEDIVSWSFRKAAGFFDIVSYTGNGSNRNISHNLGCKPGCIMIKRTDDAEDWAVYHNGFYDYQGSNHYYAKLNTTDAQQYGGGVWNNTAPTTTNFRVGTDGKVNADGATYIAYLFAGGSDRTSSTSASVGFDGSGDYLLAASSSDFTMTGDFTMEGFFNPESVSGIQVILNGRGSASSGGPVIYMNGTTLVFDNGTGTVCSKSSAVEDTYQWYHVAGTRSGNTWKLYLNGSQIAQGSDSTSYSSSVGFMIGQSHHGNEEFQGKISNVRLTKGQVLYTSSFIPPTAVLTTTSQDATASNVKLLCCNDSSDVTGSTVTAGAITSSGNPSTSIVTPFIDPESFKFGADEDKNIIKCGLYRGNGSSTGPKIYCGWEPSYVLIKNVSTSNYWILTDSMRGINSHTLSDALLYPNDDDAEDASNRLELSSTGFNIVDSASDVNGNNDFMLYIAIRRPDGYVGKPADAGTDVFTTVASPNNSNEPLYVSNFIVDFAIQKNIASTSDWYTGARLVRDEYLITNTSTSKGNMGVTYQTFDMNNGWWNGGAATQNNHNSWMWKRGQGFDVVTYTGDGNSKNDGGRNIPHSLGQAPEMMWVKCREDNTDWQVWHKDLNGGTNSGEYFMVLNNTDQESGSSSSEIWADSTPTATHFILGDNSKVNNSASGSRYIAMLFSSVSGISKVGSFSGVASASYPLTVTTGFAPRFLMIKARSGVSGYGWFIWDSVRYSGSDNLKLALDDQAAQDSGTTYQYFNDAPISTNSTGFSIVDNGWGSTGGVEFIYYAHA